MPAKASSLNLENAILTYISGESAENASRLFHIGERRLVAELRERGLFRNIKESRALSGVKTGLAQMKALPTEEIAQRYLTGDSEQTLAVSYGVSRRAIAKRLKIAGIQRRTASEANSVMARRMTDQQRLDRAQSAHNAVRGTKRSFEELCKRALIRQKRQTHVSPHEKRIIQWLHDAGLSPIGQMAIGPYNADITVGSVVVEVFGGSWHAYGSHVARAGKRLDYFLNQGWNLIFIWVDTSKWPLTINAAHYIVTFYQLTSLDPSIRGQYRVIRGDGQEMTEGSFYFNKVSGI